MHAQQTGSRIKLALLGIALALPAGQALAAVCDFNPVTGNWNDPGNWSCGIVPTGPGADTANIASGKTATVNVLGGNSIRTLNNAGTIDIDAFLLSLQAPGGTTNTGTINVGSAVTGALNVLGGHTLNNAGGAINIADGSVVNQLGATISGGTITSTGDGTFRASNSNSNTFNGVSFNGVLDLATATGIERVFGGLTLDGTIDINNNSVLSFNGDQTLDGNGSIVLGDTGSSNRALSLEGNIELTLGSGITVRGKNGTLGQTYLSGGAQSIVNNGRISADVSGGVVYLAPGGGVSNNGVLEAQNGGTLTLNTDVVGGIGSSIVAGASSTVLQNGVGLSGDINTSGDGTFRASNSNSNTFNGVSFNGVLDLATATGIERVFGGLTLDGTIDINNNSVLSFNGNQTLDGNGSIVLGDTGSSNRALSLEGNTELTLGSGITVRGKNGTLGQTYLSGGAQSIVNNGRISADVSGGVVYLAPGGGVSNNGVLEAQNGGTLTLNTDVVGGIGSSIVAGASSTVLQNGVGLSGDINTSGDGTFRASNSNSNTFNGVSFNGVLDLATATGIERVFGGLTLDGTIDINNNSVLSFNGDQTLDGNGSIVLGDTGSSNRALSLEGNIELTLGSGITVRGKNGTLGQTYLSGGAQSIVNNGRISADVSGGVVYLAPGGGVSNNGVLEAQNGGTLTLNTDVVGGIGSSIVAGASSTVLQNGVGLSGDINTSGDGTFRASNSNSNTFNGVSFNGVLDLATATGIERVFGGLTLDGTIDINNNSVLSFNGDQTLDGNGSIVLGDTGSSNRALSLEGNTELTLGSGITVRGKNGTLGQTYLSGGAQGIVNEGAIVSDGGGLITITPTTYQNDGLTHAQAGTLTIQAPLTGTGTLQVDAAGVMNLANGAKSQGTLAMGAAGASLNIGTGNLTINTDYTNDGAGSGNSFARRTGVSGAGQIVAGGDVAQAITGTGVSDGATPNATLTIDHVRVGDTTFTYQVANTGTTGPSLRGAIQTSVNGASITDGRLSGSGVTAGNYDTGGPGSDTGNLGVTFTAASAGLLAPLAGQVLNLRSNFENIADQKLNIVLGAGAAAFNVAVGDAAPDPVVVANQRVGGTNTSALTISNLAAAGGFSEALNASFGGTSGQVADNGGSIALLAAGASDSTAMQVGVDTSSAGAKAGTVTVDYESDGTGTSGLSAIGAGSQVLDVSGDVYRLAQGAATPTPINFGNRHVGDVVSQQLTVQNTALADGYSESLNASFGTSTGDASDNGGSINLLAAGGSDASAMSIGLDTSSAGAKSGSATLEFVSDGDGTSGLSAIAAGSQTIDVTGAVYRLASANLLGAINFGNVHVGDTVQQALGITNTAVADGYSESLNASFGASSDGRITTSGSISQLAAGATNASSMIVALNTAVAGLVSGTQTINFASDGTGTSGLGITALASQTIDVSGEITTSGSVYRLASASPATPNPVDFGNVRIGTLADQALSVTNTAIDDGFSEKLNASISSDGAPVTASGSFNLLGPQDTDSSSLHVGLDTSTAGAKSGSATITLVSDGDGTSGLGTTDLAPQTVDVTGAVYRLADPTLNTGNVDLVARRGDAAPSAALSVTNQSPDSFTEGLKASIGSTPAGFTGSGTITNLAAQGTDTSSLELALDTSTAGLFGGSAQVDFESTGAGTTGAADVSVGDASVSVSGKVYEAAVAQVDTTVVDFGIVHKGDVVAARNVSVTNAAPTAGLNDTLQAEFINQPSGPFSGSGSVIGLSAGATDASSLLVALDTSSAGVFSSAADNLRFASHNPDMADLDLGDAAVTLLAQVNDFVNPTFFKTSGAGTLSGGGLNFELDFGTLLAGSSAVSAVLRLTNDVSGPADLLDGIYDLLGVDDFLASGFLGFVDLAAGDSQGGLTVGLNPLLAGSFIDTIVLNAVGHNASGYRDAFGDVTLTVRARVVPVGSSVPEPATLLLLCIGLALLWSRGRVAVRAAR